MRGAALLTGIVGLALSGGALHAVDGQVEINEACAATGCFEGDAAGYPVTINGRAGRSYRLTSDLRLATVNTTGIQVTAGNVTIDLGGHGIFGPVVCEGNTTVCSASGTGDGIAVDSVFEQRGVVVFGGVVSGAGRHGVAVGNDGSVTDVRAVSNGGSGITAGGGSILTRVNASRNGGDGIDANTVVIVDSVANSNADDGIDAGGGSVVSRCSALDNEDEGVVVLVTSLVEGSVFGVNGGFGISLGGTSGYRGNVLNSNGGTVSGGVNLGGNLCDGGGCP